MAGTAKFSPTGGNLEVEIVIGQNKTGNWNCYLYDRTGTTELEPRHSGNHNGPSFIWSTPPSHLDNTRMFWEAVLNGKKGQKWILTANIRQGGIRIHGGEIKLSGTFDQVTTSVADEVRLDKK